MSNASPEEKHLQLSKRVGDFKRIDKELYATQNRIEAFREFGWPDIGLEQQLDDSIGLMKRFKDQIYREIEGMMESTVFSEWIEDHHGIGHRSVGLVTGLLPFWEDIHSVSATWKLCGLHVNGTNEAIKPQKGQYTGFDLTLRAFALKRVGEPAMRVAEGSTYYRTVFDERKERTLETHPPMMNGDGLANPGCSGCQEALEQTEELRGEKSYQRERKAPSLDCGNVRNNEPGSHWGKGHRFKDNLRVMTKAILRDWWAVGNDGTPKCY